MECTPSTLPDSLLQVQGYVSKLKHKPGMYAGYACRVSWTAFSCDDQYGRSGKRPGDLPSIIYRFAAEESPR